jgi:hypothetical protein
MEVYQQQLARILVQICEGESETCFRMMIPPKVLSVGTYVRCFEMWSNGFVFLLKYFIVHTSNCLYELDWSILDQRPGGYYGVYLIHETDSTLHVKYLNISEFHMLYAEKVCIG